MTDGLYKYPFSRLRRASRRSFLAVFVACLVWGPSPAAADETQRSGPTLEFDVSPRSETGLLVPGKPFGFSVLVKGIKPGDPEELAAIFESPAFPKRLVPLLADSTAAGFATTVEFEPPLSTVGPAGQVLRMEVTVVRLRGMNLVPLLKRAAYLTIGNPSPPTRTEPASPGPRQHQLGSSVAQAREADQVGQPLLPPEEIREEDLGGGSPTTRNPLYWKNITEVVGRSWQQELALLGKGRSSRILRVRFRLYPGGIAQLIQVERSSGDPHLDEAGLRSVLAVQPFPPFPPDLVEPSVDVHLDLPASRR